MLLLPSSVTATVWKENGKYLLSVNILNIAELIAEYV